MNRFIQRAAGFSLIEVILAIGVFALTIVAVIGLLGPISQQVQDVQDTRVANGLPDPIRDELNRMKFETFVNEDFTDVDSDWDVEDPDSVPSGETALATLVGTADGGEVAEISSDRIPPKDQYFLIQVIEPAPGGNLSYRAGDAHVAFKILITWPFRLPPDGTDEVVPENRRSFEYYTAIVVGGPI